MQASWERRGVCLRDQLFAALRMLVLVTSPFLTSISAAAQDKLKSEVVAQNGHSENVNSVAFSSDGRTALSASNDHTLKLWDVATGKLLRTFEGHTSQVVAVAISPDGHTALSGGDDETLLWDLSTGKLLRTLWGAALARQPSLSRLTAAWRCQGVSSIPNSDFGMCQRASCYALSVALRIPPSFRRTVGQCSREATRSNFGTCGLAELVRTFKGDFGEARSVAFSPDGRIAVSGDSNAMLLWDVATGKLLQTFVWRAGKTDLPR